MKNTTTKDLRDALGYSVDTIGRNRLGQIVVRKGFFYRHGSDSQSFARGVQELLDKAGMPWQVVDQGEKWRPFRGGATVSQGSHWWAVLEPRS